MPSLKACVTLTFHRWTEEEIGTQQQMMGLNSSNRRGIRRGSREQ